MIIHNQFTFVSPNSFVANFFHDSGYVENKLYEAGSINLINVLIKSGKKVIVGGGDTACFVNKFNHNILLLSK
jgi:hypothetical protein